MAIDSLIAAARAKYRCRLETLEAKIFGGAAVLMMADRATRSAPANSA